MSTPPRSPLATPSSRSVSPSTSIPRERSSPPRRWVSNSASMSSVYTTTGDHHPWFFAKWKTWFLLWSMGAACVLRIQQHADFVTVWKMVHNIQYERLQINQEASASMIFHNTNNEGDDANDPTNQRRLHNDEKADPLQRDTPETEEEYAERIRREKEFEDALRKIGQLPPEEPQSAEGEAVGPTEAPTIAPTQRAPTPAPTSFSYYRNPFQVVHVIHTPFLLSIPQAPSIGSDATSTTEPNNGDDSSSTSTKRGLIRRKAQEDPVLTSTGNPITDNLLHLAKAHLELWKNVAVPSLRKQVSQDFLYIVWVNQETLHPTILEALKQTLQLELPMGNAVILDIGNDSNTDDGTFNRRLGTTTGTGSNRVPLDFRSNPWYEDTHVGHRYMGGLAPMEHIRDYREASQSRPLLETTLQVTDALFKEFTSRVQRDAAKGLVLPGSNHPSANDDHPDEENDPSKAVATEPFFQIWCANLYLEWFIDNPWNKKSVRGVIVGQMGLVPDHNHHPRHQQQCDFSSGLTVGTTVGKDGVDYDIQLGINQKLKHNKPTSTKEAIMAWFQKPQAAGHLPPCHDAPQDCIRYVDVGLNEYAVFRARGWSAVENLDRVEAGRKVAPQWRGMQDHAFSILKGRFGFSSKFLSQTLKPYLMDEEYDLVMEQSKWQQKLCTRSNSILGRRLTPFPEDHDPSQFPKGCSLVNWHAVEKKRDEIQQDLTLQEQEEQVRLEQLKKAQAAMMAGVDSSNDVEDNGEVQETMGKEGETLNTGDMAQITLPKKKPKPSQPFQSKWQNDNDLVHVVHTRFAQHQAQLMHMGKARIDLFRTFCAPSILQQTNQDFMWLIWTDPGLNKELLYGLMESLKDFPNAVIVGSTALVNKDFREDMNGLGSPIYGTFNKKSVLYGSADLLIDYHKQSQKKIMLETRLDADDALSKEYFETIQLEAKEGMAKNKPDDFRVWCANRYVDWRYYSPLQEQLGNHMGSNKGFLAPEQDVRGCVTVGLTIGFQVEAQMNMLPTKEHHKIREALPACKVKPRQCVQGVEPDKDHFLGFRARTPTSTSMVNVVSQDVVGSDGSLLSQDQVWESIEHDFDISPGSVWDLRERFQANLPDILLDAIAGLCKDGHSCRYSSKAMLMKLLKEAVSAPEPIEPVEIEEQAKQQEDHKHDAIQEYLDSLKEHQQKNYAASQAAQTAANTKLVLFPELNKKNATSDASNSAVELEVPSSSTPNRTISKLFLSPSSKKDLPPDSSAETNATNATQVQADPIRPVAKDTDWARRAQEAKARMIQMPEKSFLPTKNSTGALSKRASRIPKADTSAVKDQRNLQGGDKKKASANADPVKASPTRTLVNKPTDKPTGNPTAVKDQRNLPVSTDKAGAKTNSVKTLPKSAVAKKPASNKESLRGSQQEKAVSPP